MPSNKTRLFHADAGNFSPLNSGRCPLCGGSNASFGAGSYDGTHKVFQGWCPACTNVCIAQETNDEVKRRGIEHLLSAALRRFPADRWGDEIGRLIEIPTVNKLISSITEPTVLEQLDSTLKCICDMCPVVGQRSSFNYMEDLSPDYGAPA